MVLHGGDSHAADLVVGGAQSSSLVVDGGALSEVRVGSVHGSAFGPFLDLGFKALGLRVRGCAPGLSATGSLRGRSFGVQGWGGLGAGGRRGGRLRWAGQVSLSPLRVKVVRGRAGDVRWQWRDWWGHVWRGLSRVRKGQRGRGRWQRGRWRRPETACGRLVSLSCARTLGWLDRGVGSSVGGAGQGWGGLRRFGTLCLLADVVLAFEFSEFVCVEILVVRCFERALFVVATPGVAVGEDADIGEGGVPGRECRIEALNPLGLGLGGVRGGGAGVVGRGGANTAAMLTIS